MHLIITRLFCLFLFVCGGFAADGKPNILFFFSDDHSLQTLGAHPGRMQEFIKTHNVTPNLDRLASEGMYFANSFVCNSLCGPSRAAILTGKHSWVNGFKRNGDRFDGEQWTMPKAFQKAGYQTAVFGKWHLGTVPTGFDVSYVLPGQGKYYNPDFQVNGKNTVTKNGYCSDIIGDLTIEWLKNRKNKDKPFFLCSWHKAPHRTWMPPERYFEFLDDVSIPEPDTLFDEYSGRYDAAKHTMGIENEINLQMDVKVTPPVSSTTIDEITSAVEKTKSRDTSTLGEFKRMTQEQKEAWDAYYVQRNKKFLEQKLKGKDLIRWKYQQYMKDYIRCVKAMDDNVGRVIDYLKETGEDKNTIIVYSSDQGFYNGEHGWYDKRWMYEESLRTPLIIKWADKIKPDSKENKMVQNIDIAPTLLDCANIEIPNAVQGKSFKLMLEGKAPELWRNEILYTYYEHGGHGVAAHYGIRTERFKLIRFDQSDKWELFDLANDKQELNNLINDAEYSTTINELKQRLSGLMEKYQVKMNK